MAKAKTHPADTADFPKIETATKFAATLFLGRGQYAKVETDTLEAARKAAAGLPAEHKSTKLPLVYALVDGVSVLVPDSYPGTNGEALPAFLDRKKNGVKPAGRGTREVDEILASWRALPAREAKPAKAKPAPTIAAAEVAEVNAKPAKGKAKPAPKAAKAAPAKAKPAKAEKPAKGKPAARPDGLRPGTKMAQAVDMVCRKGGATCAQIAKALGWSVLNASTLKGYCETAKVKLAEGEDGYWFGTAK